jgi:two-component system CheB/CheR fusion protein
VLFLGTSEGIGEFDKLFSVVDRKAKLYQRRDDIPGQCATRPLFFPLVPATRATQMVRSESKTAFPLKMPLRELTEQSLLQQVIAAGVLVNGRGDILYLHGRTGMFLEPAPGEAGINNILKMAREGLRLDLTTTLHKAAGINDTVHCPGVRVKTNGHFTTVNLTVRPVTTGAGASPESPLYLVILEEVSETEVRAQTSEIGAPPDTDARIAKLTQELRAKEEYLQSTNEELESSAEELKSSNEEMQSVNEELQSTNEELETSKEELQSVNEELSTVNTELQNKVLDLSRANNDMNNLLAGTGIGTVFVDHQLRIMRFTPAAAPIINLIPGDLGRPIAHFVSNLVGYNSLIADVKAVLNTLAPKAVDVQVAEGKWYAMRIQPYRTLDNVIEGAVITFAEITEIVQARETLRRLAVVVRDTHDAITVQDLEGRIIAWNPGSVRMYGWSEAEALTMNVRDRIPAPLRKDALAKLIQLGHAEILEPYRTERLTKQGKVVKVSIISTALLDATGKMYAIATTERMEEGGVK